jgi:hypothetical protein
LEFYCRISIIVGREENTSKSEARMESSIRVEKTHFLQQDEYDNDDDDADDHDSLTTTMTKCSSRSTAELAFESSLQASFAEKTALEMKELMDYWKATVTTPTLITATRNMPHNSLTVLAEEEQEEEEAGSIMEDHDDKDEDTASAESSDHDDDDNDTVDSSYQAPQMPPRHVLFSRERRISTSYSNLTCVTNLLPDDDGLAEFSFSLHSKGGNKQLCDNASSATTASTHMMSSTYSCDTSTISESCSFSASCCHHQLALFPPLSTTTTCATPSNCGAGHYPVIFWSDDNHSMIHTTTPPTGGEKEDYTPVILQDPPCLLVSHQCDASEASSPSSSSAVAVEHFHWTACQQQTLVNVACSRAQWMADSWRLFFSITTIVVVLMMHLPARLVIEMFYSNNPCCCCCGSSRSVCTCSYDLLVDALRMSSILAFVKHCHWNIFACGYTCGT